MKKTEHWCDVMSLGPPDGLFMTHFQDALKVIAENAKGKKSPIIVRMMFGNIIGMPVNCNSVIKALTKRVPKDANIRLWVGAWRRGVSWNHAKIIAVDGKVCCIWWCFVGDYSADALYGRRSRISFLSHVSDSSAK